MSVALIGRVPKYDQFIKLVVLCLPSYSVGQNSLDKYKMDIAKGKYERTDAKNYDELLKALDVNFLLRKAATASTPVMEVTEEGGEWTIKTSTVLKSMELKFKVGEKFDETTPDGRQVDSIVTVEGNKFICVQTAKKDGEKSTKSTREFTDEGCTYTIEVTGTDVVSTQVFKRV